MEFSKPSLLTRIFSYEITKWIWYFLRGKISSPISRIPDSPHHLRTIIWGCASLCGPKTPPKIVWTYWSGDLSPSAEICQRTWDVYLHGYEIRRLSPDNIHHYIPEMPIFPSDLPIQLQSDWIRLTLLKNFGGIWIDYSTILTKPIDWAFSILEKNRTEVLAFYNEFPDEYRSSDQAPVIENGFLIARAQSKFISDWRDEFHDCIFSKDYRDHFRQKPNYDQLTFNFLNKNQKLIDYLCCYISAQAVMFKSDNYRLALLNVEDDYYYYYYKTNPPRKQWKFAEELLLKRPPKWGQSGVIKITGGHRKILDDYIAHRCFRVKSILGNLIK